MISNPIKFLGTLALLLSMAACTADGGFARMAATHPDPRGIETTKLMLTGNESNVVLSNTGQLRQVLADFGGNTNPANLKSMIQQIRASNEISGIDIPGLTGLGGGYGHAFLDLAGDAILGNGHFNQGARVVVTISGQILDYEFNRTINNDTGNGRLEVVTYITRRVVPAGAGMPSAKTDAYKWKIRVIDDGFTVVHRNDADPDGPFPGTIPFSSEMKDRVNSLGFVRKLWAKGEKIVVDEVKFVKDYTPGTDWTSVPPLDPGMTKYARLYESDANSCIDMMFAGEPPATMADLQGPPFYCLGRCAHPWIVNTR